MIVLGAAVCMASQNDLKHLNSFTVSTRGQ